MRKPVSNRQYLDTEILVLEIDGSDVSTTAGSDGLDVGAYQCNIKKGENSDANLITITFKKPIWGKPPRVFIQERTVDCLARLESDPTVSTVVIRTYEADGTTAENDADLSVLLVGTPFTKEGNY